MVDDLLGQANVDPTLRATQIDMDGVERLCQAFIEITNSKELDLLPLKVNRPIPVS